MPIVVRNINLHPDEDESLLVVKAAEVLGVDQAQFRYVRLLRASLDARKKADIHFNCIVAVALEADIECRLIAKGKADEIKTRRETPLSMGETPLHGPVVIVGLGPCGLFAALTLLRAGFPVICIERGKRVDERADDVEAFWRGGVLDENSNVLFGAGGAGTFSDGKLTTRIKDERVGAVIDDFIRFGAPDRIRIAAKPHIGTDVLRGVVRAVCAEIEALGGQIRFETKLTNIDIENGALKAISAGNERLECGACLLALGHSARDTYEMLLARGVNLVPKPFAVGVRIEHPQELIDKAQFGALAGHKKLGAAEYALTARTRDGRGVYTFCMCPGGVVVASASEGNGVVVNGMSYASRGGKNANSAVVAQVSPEDFGGGALRGIAFQRELERAAFEAGGRSQCAPAQRLDDFMKRRVSTGFEEVVPSYRPGVTRADLWKVLPEFVAGPIAEGIYAFARQLKGFDLPSAVLTGVESRTSAPVRIERNALGEAFENLYPAGEGSGYAGGIMSSAVDGIRAAERIISKYKV